VFVAVVVLEAREKPSTYSARRPGRHVPTSVDQVVSLRAGVGLAPLLCYLADPNLALCRRHPPLLEMESVLWLLTHLDLCGVARSRALLDFLAGWLIDRRQLIEGRGM
jgi:hypothetical protein